MPKGPLRASLENWVSSTVNPTGGPGYFDRVRERFIITREPIERIGADAPTYNVLSWILVWLAAGLYGFTGATAALKYLQDTAEYFAQPSLSGQIGSLLKNTFANPVVKEITQIFGAAIIDPMLGILEMSAGDDQSDPKEIARSLMGLVIDYNVATGLMDMTVSGLTAGTVGNAGDFIEAAQQSMGLGYIGNQVLTPLLANGLRPGMDRYYSKLFRPNRFSAAELRDLYALGEITPEALRTNAQFLGWRDEDIDQWIKLAFRSLAEGDIFAGYYKKYITEPEAVKRLRGLGYDPKDIPLLFQLNPDPDAKEDKATSSATARAAYRDNLISSDELVTMLRTLKIGDPEIDLIIALENAKKKLDQKTLSVSQIKQAWTDNVLHDSEAEHWLTLAGFGEDEIRVLLLTWKEEAVPAYRKLNSGTILGAYVAGIVNRNTAKDKLLSVGYSPEDAGLELDLAQARNPEAFGIVTKKGSKSLSLSNYTDLLTVGLITSEQMRAGLLEIGYTEADAALLVQASVAKLQAPNKLLSQDQVGRAYLAGVFTRPQAEAGLKSLQFSDAQVKTILDTLEKENPDTFGQTPAQRALLLSPGTLSDLYIKNLITAEELHSRLIALGVNEIDAGLLKDRADELKRPAVRVLTPALIQRAYLAGILDRVQAKRKLVELEYSEENAELILSTIESENPGAFQPGLIQSLRAPSIQALVSAVSNTIITEDEYFSRAVEIGWAPTDAAMFLLLGKSNERKGSKALSLSQLLTAYNKGLMPRGEALSRISSLGYADADAILLLRMEKDLIELTDTWNQIMSLSLPVSDGINALIELHYSDEDIYNAFASLSPGQLTVLGVELTSLSQFLQAVPGGA
jgi:hypothetical protein